MTKKLKNEKEPTLLETVKCDLALGETVLVTELARWSDDEGQIEEAVAFLRQQAARGTILRIFPRELYIAAHEVKTCLEKGGFVRKGGRLYEV